VRRHLDVVGDRPSGEPTRAGGDAVMRESLERLLGAPVLLQELAPGPGRNRTLRASGSRGRGVVQIYASGPAPTVAARIARLAGGPAEPRMPRVLAFDPGRNALVLSEVPGRPFREALLERDRDACRRVGQVLAVWHGAWRGQAPSRALAVHAGELELRGLRARLERASHVTRAVGSSALSELAGVRGRSTRSSIATSTRSRSCLASRSGSSTSTTPRSGLRSSTSRNLCANVELLCHRNGLDLGPMEDALVRV